MAEKEQVWTATIDGHSHRVVGDGSFRHRARWWIDDELVAEKSALEDTLRIEDATHGHLVVRWSGLGTPRTAVWHPAGSDVGPLAGVGGRDLTPEPGSAAERYENKVLAHPTRFTVLAGLGGVAKVVVPILLVSLLARFAFSLPLPSIDLPDIPWPSVDLPGIPWPDLPAIPWPDWSLPAWLREALGYVKYVWPVLLALVVARTEVRRRRQHAAMRDTTERDD